MAYSHLMKITRPEISGAIIRERVFSLLQCLCNKPIIWISAPAGSGKTTLASSFIETFDIPCLWYQMDEGDTDIASFFYHMQLAVKKEFHNKSHILPLLTPEYAHGETTFARRYFEGVFEILLHESTPPGWLVLDNYHLVPDNSNLHRVLASGLEAFPAVINIIIISRYSPPSQFARLRANGRISLLDWDKIRFSEQEAEELIRLLLCPVRKRKVCQEEGTDIFKLMSFGGEGKDSIMKKIIRVTDGWAAGLVLFAEGIKSGEFDPAFYQEKLLPEEIIEYFGEEICSSIAPDLMDFLIKTSFLPRMTFYSAEAISNNRFARRILSELNRRNYFTEKHNLQPQVYKYHPLFRDFLQKKALEGLSRDEFSKIHKKAANLLAKTGQTEHSITLFLDGGQYNSAVRLILPKARGMIAKGKHKTLEKWLFKLPVSAFREQPWLYYWLAESLLLISPEQALNYFRYAFQGLKDKKDEEGTLQAWSGAVEAILLEWNDFARLDFWITWLDDRMKEGLSFPSKDSESRVVASMIGAILSRCPRHPRAQKWLDLAEKIIQDSPAPETGLHFYYLFIYYMIFGDFQKASLLVNRLKPYIFSAPAILQVKQYLIEAMFANMAEGSGEKAIELAEKGLSMARSLGIQVYDSQLLAQVVQGALNAYDTNKADNYLKIIDGVLKSSSLGNVSYYHYLFSCTELFKGNHKNSIEHIQLALNIVEKIGCPLSQALIHIGMANVFLEMMDIEMANSHIAKARSIIPGQEDTFEFMYLLTEARVFFGKKNHNQLINKLGKALRLGLKHSYSLPQFYSRESMSTLCATALEHGIETDYVCEIIKRRNLSPLLVSQEQACIINWPYDLRIFTLGRFEIELQGNKLEFSGKVPKKTLDMLKLLISLGVQDVPAEKIIDALYPDVDGDKAYNSFRYILYELRRLLCDKKYLLMSGGMLSLDFLFCFVDIKVFLELCRLINEPDQISKAPPSGRAGQYGQNQPVLQLCHKAMDLYKGDFLKNDESEWAFSARERFKRQYMRVVDIAANCYKNCDLHHKAVEYYEKAIEKDELQEKFYRQLMLTHEMTGQIAEAISVYERCCSILHARLGIKPSSETRAVYNSLITRQ